MPPTNRMPCYKAVYEEVFVTKESLGMQRFVDFGPGV